MREQVSDWILLHGNRYVVAGCLLALSSAIVVLPILDDVLFQTEMPVYYLSTGLIAGNITLITVVVAITQLILSRELESPGELQEEIEQTADYWRTTIDQPVAPTVPSNFLQQLIRQTHRHTSVLDDDHFESTDHQLQTAVDHLTTDLLAHCEAVDEYLEQTNGRLFTVITPVLGSTYADYIYDVERIRASYSDPDHKQRNAVFNILLTDLRKIDIARQYFTTIAVTEELALLSRVLLYVGIPAVAAPIALLIEVTSYSGSSLPVLKLFIITLVTTVVGLLPLALLSSFVLRIATIAQQITPITPFKTS